MFIKLFPHSVLSIKNENFENYQKKKKIFVFIPIKLLNQTFVFCHFPFDHYKTQLIKNDCQLFFSIRCIFSSSGHSDLGRLISEKHLKGPHLPVGRW